MIETHNSTPIDASSQVSTAAIARNAQQFVTVSVPLLPAATVASPGRDIQSPQAVAQLGVIPPADMSSGIMPNNESNIILLIGAAIILYFVLS